MLIIETPGARLPRPIIWPPYPPPHPPIPIPPPRPVPPPPEISYSVESLSVNGRINNQVAQVEVAQTFRNTGSRTLEASFVFPLPYDGAIDRMTLMVDGREIPARLLKADEARREYESIVRRNRDPALLEWVGTGMFKTSVFPIPPGQSRTVSLRYTQLCRQQDGMVDFLFPLSTAKYTSKPLRELEVRVNLREDEEIKNIYCPSHDVEVKRLDSRTVTVTYSARDIVPLSDFRLMYDVAPGLVSAKLLSYKSPDEEDGFFLLLAAPQIATQDGKPLPKTVMFVLDRSGSMSGKKIEQLRQAMQFVLNNLREEDLFNIIAYDSDVEAFRPELQRFNDKTRREALAFVEGLVAGGSTNIDAALRTAFSQLQDDKRPTYIVFMTDGLPTTGVTNEMQIVENAKNANTVKARIFCFGIGYDVNSRLLDKLARTGRGYTEYVRPDENLETRISSFYRRIEAPVLTDVTVDVVFDEPPGPPPVYRLNPQPPFDLFAGEQLALVGRYRKSGRAEVVLKGRIDDEQKEFRFPVDFVARSGDESKAFVEKLWAIRRVGDILDEIDLHGKNPELIDELTRLAMKHGIVTPYTSFIANENVPIHDLTQSRRETESRLRALEAAEGYGGFAQRSFKGRMQQAQAADAASALRSFGGLGAEFAAPSAAAPGGAGMMGGVAASAPALAPAEEEIARAATGETMRYVGNRVFYKRQGQWIDGTLKPEQQQNPIRIKQFSEEYFNLVRQYGRQVSQYLVFDEPTLVNINNQAYLIEP
ncbi:MAG TPA: VIT domain-containing protein [Thermogutta sp.]|nr:VIT domain-containing protein [Thermogutta sp.]